MINVAVYSPYLDTFGGGEKYLLTAAAAWAGSTHVDLLIDTNLKTKDPEELLKKLEERFNLDLSKINLVLAPLGPGSNLVQRSMFLKRYDLLFSFTDGSIYYSSAKKSVLHIQSPIVNTNSESAWGRVKLSSWDLIVYNSEFTKENAQRSWKIKGVVIYPPVDVEEIKPLKKEKIILSVGRFFGFLKMKKHEVMIETFTELVKSGSLKGWNLVLAGGSMEGDERYVEELKKMAKDLPVEFLVNVSHDDLVKLYGKATIYWHAMGYSETDPTKMEHFGITVVEAMAGGAIPVVVNAGGLPEIVENKVSGFTWDNLEELKTLTLDVANGKVNQEKIAKEAAERSSKFSTEVFIKKIKELM